MTGIKITPEGTVTTVELSKPLYRSAGNVVGGWIEIVRPRGLKRPYCMMVNDNFLIQDLPLNRVGSYLYETHIHGAPICGTIIILKEQGDDLAGLTPDEAQEVTKAMEMIQKLTATEVWRRAKKM